MNYGNSNENDFTDRALDSLIAAGASEEEKLRHLGYEGGYGSFEKFVYRQALKIYQNKAGGLFKTFYDTIPIAMFFLLPIFALILKIF